MPWLNSSQVLTHPFVIGELACGNLRNRDEVLALLKDLPRVAVATDEEVLFYQREGRQRAPTSSGIMKKLWPSTTGRRTG